MVYASGYFRGEGGGPRWYVNLKVEGQDFHINRIMSSASINEVVAPEVILEELEPQDDGARYIVRKLERMNLENYNFVDDGF